MSSEWDGTSWAGSVREDAAPLVTGVIDTTRPYPSVDAQLLALQHSRQHAGIYAPLSVKQALSIPAVFRSVNLIAGMVGALDVQTWRDERIDDPVPRLIARPDPFLTRREFYGSGAWSLAAYGEAIAYVSAQGAYKEPLSVMLLPVNEVRVEWADEIHWQKRYYYRDRELDRERVKHIVKSLQPGQLRGFGPLQSCGAALSAASEADQWASTYFAEGGLSAVHLHSEGKLSDTEADIIRARWSETRGALRITSGGIVQTQNVSSSPDEAQLLETRLHSRGEVAVMFGIPGKLLEYAESGSSLTYQNVGEVMTEFVRQELAPGYLEPIEQAMSDLLPRAMEVRFDVSGIQRADVKTRYDVHEKAIRLGIYDAKWAHKYEGIDAPLPKKPEPVALGGGNDGAGAGQGNGVGAGVGAGAGNAVSGGAGSGAN